jgi:hypothetical protein
MEVEKFEDLNAWQVADELRREVYALTATGPASQDFKSAIRSATPRHPPRETFLRDSVDTIRASLHGSWTSALPP